MQPGPEAAERGSACKGLVHEYFLNHCYAPRIDLKATLYTV